MSNECRRCGGSGQVFNEKQTAPWSDCAYCGGSGYAPLPTYPCAKCAELKAENERLREVALAAAPRWVETKQTIRPTHEAADAFWKYWRENGDTHKHGYYESTWGAINAALNSTGQLEQTK